jgi:hypothetical protein
MAKLQTTNTGIYDPTSPNYLNPGYGGSIQPNYIGVAPVSGINLAPVKTGQTSGMTGPSYATYGAPTAIPSSGVGTYTRGAIPGTPYAPASTTVGSTASRSSVTTGLTDAQIATKNAAADAANLARYGNGTTPPPVPGSVASLYTAPVNPDQAAIDRLNGIVGDTSQITDPTQLYNQQLGMYQDQINNTNSLYADMLNRARIEGQGNIESRQFSQGRSGQIGSGTGEAGIGAVKNANEDVYRSIEAQRANAISEIYTKVRTGAADILAKNTEAKKLGAKAMLDFYNVEKPALIKKNTSSAVKALLAKGVDISKMTPEELKSYTDGLGISKEDFTAAYSDAKATQDKANADIKAEAYKNLPESAKEFTYLKTLSPAEQEKYRAYQTEDANRKAAGGGQKLSQWEVNQQRLSEFSSALGQSLDQNNKLTPAQFLGYQRQYIAAGLGTAKEFNANYAQHVYINPKDKQYNYTSAGYGLPTN